MSYPFVEQQVRTSVIPIRFEHIFGKNVRNQFVVDAYPRFAGFLGHVPVRMKNVEGVVSTGGRQAVVIQNCCKGVSRSITAILESLSPTSEEFVLHFLRLPTPRGDQVYKNDK